VNETLLELDRSLFYFCNQGLRSWIFDAIFPFITDLNRKPVALVIVGILWLLLLTRGGRHGRIAALLLIPTITVSDQLNSSVLKFLVERARPCQDLANVHLLVGCGSGYSFPSSHAVNNFAGAIVLAYFLPRWTWAFFTFAFLVAFSRVYVGVHYPSDVVAGAIIGLAIGAAVIAGFRALEEWWIRRTRHASSVRQ
jgi:undecaprenyl-diphosphatase